MRQVDSLVDDETVLRAADTLGRTFGLLPKFPEDFWALRQRAGARLVFGLRTGLLNMHTAALSDYDEILRQCPTDAMSHVCRGRALACLGRHDEALESLEPAMNLHHRTPLRMERGKRLFALKRYPEAAMEFAHAASNAANPGARAWRSAALSRDGKLGQSLEYLGQAAELSNAAPARNLLAAAMLRAKRNDEATAHFKIAISIDPCDTTLQAEEDDLYWFGHGAPVYLGEDHSAEGFAGTDAPGCACRIREFFRLARISGNVSDTIHKLQQELAINPGNLEAYLGLGIACLAARRFDDACEAFGWAVSVDAGSLEAHFNRCRALAIMGRHEEARESLGAATGLARADAGHRLREANALCRLGFPALALKACQVAADLDPASPEAHKTMAAIHTSLGRHAEALASVDMAIRLVPGDAISHVHRGYVLESMRRTSDSLGAYYRAGELNPATWSLPPQP